MSAPVKSSVSATASPSSENANAVASAAPSFEERLNGFWAKNRKLLFLLCAVVLVVIVSREVSTISANRSRDRLAKSYAEAAATPEGLRRFAQENAGLPLGGVAWLQVADTAYEADDFSEAVTAYEQSLKGLTRGSAFADRAALGLAVAQMKNGAADQGRVGLIALADAATVSVAVRAEAAYHLAIFAHVAGEQESFGQRAAQLAQIDPMSLWNQRLLSLQMTRALPMPQTVLSPTEAAAPSVESDTAPRIQFNVGN